jgi:hypothetical protein
MIKDTRGMTQQRDEQPITIKKTGENLEGGDREGSLCRGDGRDDMKEKVNQLQITFQRNADGVSGGIEPNTDNVDERIDLALVGRIGAETPDNKGLLKINLGRDKR